MKNHNHESAEGESQLSTKELVKVLIEQDPRKGDGLSIYKVNFNPELLVELINSPESPYKVLPSGDGLIATVQEDMDNDPKPIDFSHRSSFFDLHQDGLYYPKIPALAILHCDNPGTESMPSFFVDTMRILEQLSTDELEKLSQLEFVYMKKDGSQYIHPVVKSHTQSGKPIISLASNRAYIRPQKDYLPDITARQTAKLMNRVFEISDSVERQHIWKKDDFVIFDNERYLHGRGVSKSANPDTRDMSRKLTRIFMTSK